MSRTAFLWIVILSLFNVFTPPSYAIGGLLSRLLHGPRVVPHHRRWRVPQGPQPVGPAVETYCKQLSQVPAQSFSSNDLIFMKSSDGHYHGELRSRRGGVDCPVPEHVVRWYEEIGKSNPQWAQQHPSVKQFLAFRGHVLPGVTQTPYQSICASIINQDPKQIPSSEVMIGRGTVPNWRRGEFKVVKKINGNTFKCPAPQRVIDYYLKKLDAISSINDDQMAALKFYGVLGIDGVRVEPTQKQKQVTPTQKQDPMDDMVQRMAYAELERAFSTAKDVQPVDLLKLSGSKQGVCSEQSGPSVPKAGDRHMFFYTSAELGKSGVVGFGLGSSPSDRPRLLASGSLQLRNINDSQTPVAYQRYLSSRRGRNFTLQSSTEIKTDGGSYFLKMVGGGKVTYCQFYR